MSPDRRRHRGAHPDDPRLFAPERLPTLRAAVAELSWLLSRDYAPTSSLKLVGDRHQLAERQRIAVGRAACPDAARAHRRATRVARDALAGAGDVAVDGFNLVVTVEAALGGCLLMRCRDGCVRDLASVHRSYRVVAETDHAIELVGAALAEAGPRAVRWLLDSPVSNSGRLAQRLRALAAARGWPWTVEAVFSPDAVLREFAGVVVTSDSAVLAAARTWVPVVEAVLPHAPAAWIVDLGEPVAGDGDAGL